MRKTLELEDRGRTPFEAGVGGPENAAMGTAAEPRLSDMVGIQEGFECEVDSYDEEAEEDDEHEEKERE